MFICLRINLSCYGTPRGTRFWRISCVKVSIFVWPMHNIMLGDISLLMFLAMFLLQGCMLKCALKKIFWPPVYEMHDKGYFFWRNLTSQLAASCFSFCRSCMFEVKWLFYRLFCGNLGRSISFTRCNFVTAFRRSVFKNVRLLFIFNAVLTFVYTTRQGSNFFL